MFIKREDALVFLFFVSPSLLRFFKRFFVFVDGSSRLNGLSCMIAKKNNDLYCYENRGWSFSLAPSFRDHG